MARKIKQGQHVFIAFQDGEAVLDSQLRPRMYKSREQFEKSFPACRDGKAELVEYAPTLTPPNEWVSVENAVPDPGERVLATDGTFVGEAYRTSANTWYRHTGFPWRDCLQSIVTLWMPLPTADKDNHVHAKAPNEPLTIEQLREMKDEPAYLKVFDPLLKSGWHIIKAVTKDKIIFRGWQTVYVPIDGMGVNYNLYRRPPEGEEET